MVKSMHEILQRLTEIWNQKLRQELSPFCDPGTELQIAHDKSSIVCELTFRGEKKELNLKIREDKVTLQFKGQEIGYKDFLGSVHLADLRSLAKMIAQTSKEDLYVPAKVTKEGDHDEVVDFDNKFIERIKENDREYTQLLMVTGEAGSGKTSALKNLVKVGAERYLRGESGYVYLYINAQGRALSRFNEALATELNELRSVIPYHGITTLVKNGLIIPIVDGFDELLGISGSEDAFSSLSAFIEELDGTGTVLASSRSSYFENEFRAKANQKSSLGAQSWILNHCKILKWGTDEVNEFIEKFSKLHLTNREDIEYFVRSIDKSFASHPDLKYKPLFLSKVAEITSIGEDVSPTDDLLTEIVSIQLKRECFEKLLSKTKAPILQIDQLLNLYTEIAEEMWNQETRELNKETINFVAEYILSEYSISNEHKEYIVARLPNAALLMPGETKGSLSFEHEAFFDYFISSRLSNIIKVDESIMHIQSVYGRSHLSSELSRRIKAHAFTAFLKNVGQFLGIINSVAAVETSRSPIVRENFGRVLGAFLAGEKVDFQNTELRSIIFPEIDFQKSIVEKATFTACEFRSSNFRNSKFINCSSKKSVFFESVIEIDKTILDISGVDWEEEIIGIKTAENEDPIYDPEKLIDILTKVSVIKTKPSGALDFKRKVSENRLRILEKFFNLYKKRNPISTGDEFFSSIFEDADWNALEKILLKNKVVTSETRAMSGPQKYFLRRQVLPEEFLKAINKNAQVPLNIANAWKEIEELK
jgi:hypothetical protein